MKRYEVNEIIVFIRKKLTWIAVIVVTVVLAIILYPQEINDHVIKQIFQHFA